MNEQAEISEVHSFASAILRAKFGCLEDMLIELVQLKKNEQPINVETLQSLLRNVKESQALLAQV